MTNEQLRDALHARPFRPFNICLADGRQLPVPSPEFLLVPPQFARTFVVAIKPDVYRVIDLLLVTSLDFGFRRRQRRKAG